VPVRTAVFVAGSCSRSSSSSSSSSSSNSGSSSSNSSNNSNSNSSEQLLARGLRGPAEHNAGPIPAFSLTKPVPLKRDTVWGARLTRSSPLVDPVWRPRPPRSSPSSRCNCEMRIDAFFQPLWPARVNSSSPSVSPISIRSSAPSQGELLSVSPRTRQKHSVTVGTMKAIVASRVAFVCICM